MSLNSPPDLPISFYLLKNCKLWVWDFDDTLIDSTTYIKRDMSPSKIRIRTDAELDIEVPQWRYFKRLVEFLVMHGRYVGIASFGTYEIIQAYLDRIMGFNQKYFNKNNIIAPTYSERGDRAFTLPPHKNEYIYKLMQMYKVQDFKRVVLFDDMASNISEATAIGIVAIQIATPRNGDDRNLYFGAWLMDDFDSKIADDCGKEIYLNRTFTGVSNKNNEDTTDAGRIPYSGTAFDKMDFGTGVQEKFHPMAFGTGIGSRRVNTKPEYRWNNMNVEDPPLWQNGNWGDSSTLGGVSPSFWDSHQSVGNYTADDGKTLFQTIQPYNLNLAGASNNIVGISVEGFIAGFEKSRAQNNAGFEKSRAQNNAGFNKGARGAEALAAGFEKSRAQNNDAGFNKGARGAEALVAGFEKSRAQNNAGFNKGARGAEALAAGFEKSRAQNKNNNKRKNNSNNRNSNNKGASAEATECGTCGKLDWNWIILVLMVIIAMMALIVFNVM